MDLRAFLRGRWRVFLLVFLAAAVGVFFCYGWFVEPFWVEVSRVALESNKLGGGSLRVVQFSDLHCDAKAGNELVLSGLINPLEPDVVVFTGDLINNLDALPECRQALAGVNATLGKYAVMGNWDGWFGNGSWLFNGTGFRVLDGESVRLEKNEGVFYLTGLRFGFSDSDFDVLYGIPEDGYSIFLYHKPDLAEDLDGMNVDLYLAGHTHGGQIALPFYGALITLSKYGKKYEAGLYRVGNVTLYVNRGLGMEGGLAPRMRLFARPEITVFDINPVNGS